MTTPSDLTPAVTKPWKTIVQSDALVIAATVSGADKFLLSSSVGLISGGNLLVPSGIIQITAADAEFVMEGKTPRCRVVLDACPNATAWGAGGTIQLGLFPLTVTGGVGVATVALGTNAIPTASLPTAQAPVASTPVRLASNDFALPADGLYGVGFVSSAAWAANTAALCNAKFQLDFV